MSNVDNISVVIKTFLRPDRVEALIDSIRLFYPTIKIIVVNDGDDQMIWEDENMRTLLMPFNSGLSAGRNYGVEQCDTEFFVLCDDDFIFTEKTDLVRWRELLVKYDMDIMACRLEKTFASEEWSWLWYHEDGLIKEKPGHYHAWKDKGFFVKHVDFVLNSFMARTKSIQDHPWDEKYKKMEHRPYFYKYRNAMRIGWCEEIEMGHPNKPNPARYNHYRRKDVGSYRQMHKQDGYFFSYETTGSTANDRISSVRRKTKGPRSPRARLRNRRE